MTQSVGLFGFVFFFLLGDAGCPGRRIPRAWRSILHPGFRIPAGFVAPGPAFAGGLSPPSADGGNGHPSPIPRESPGISYLTPQGAPGLWRTWLPPKPAHLSRTCASPESSFIVTSHCLRRGHRSKVASDTNDE